MGKKKVLSTDSYVKMIPLALILLIVPLIVHLKTVKLTGAALVFSPNSDSYPDFFNYFKAIWLEALTIISFLVCLWYFNSKKYTFKVSKLFIPLGIYYFGVIISTLLSDYKHQSLFGFNDRFEGFFVITCYMTICFLAAHFITFEKDVKILFGALVFSAVIISLLGISQFWGFDILQSDFGKHLMLSANDYKEIGESLEFKFPTRYIYATLYNPNYVGSYFSMLFPISLILFLFSNSLKNKILSGIFSCLTFITLVGCLSTTGYIGAFFAILIILLILYKKVIKSWKSVIPLFLCLVGILLLMNLTANGTLLPGFAKTTTQGQNNSGITDIATSKPDNSLKDIKLVKNSASIITVDNVLNIQFDNSNYQCLFSDQVGNKLDFKIDETDNKTLTFNDSRYEGIKIIIDGAVFNITTSNTVFNICVNKDTGYFKFMDHRGNQVDIVDVDKIGFEGKETFASSRGYIWSRTLPLLKDTLFWGHGPDTFAFVFPQNDFLGKVKAFNSPYIIVDKPHNMFLQISVNTGLLSLLAFLVFIMWYAIVSVKLYIMNKSDNIYFISGVSCLVAVMGFMISAFANDSVISVSPVFWIILGIGIASNRLYKSHISSIKLTA